MHEHTDATKLYEGKHLRLVKHGQWEFTERVRVTGAAVIVAMTDDGRMLLTEQHRIPVAGRVIELPAGLAGDIAEEAHETLETAARRELREETGYEAREMAHLVTGPSSPGLTSELVSLFLATGLRQVGPGGGHGDERIQVHSIPLAEIHQWLRRRIGEGLLVDPKVFAGIYFARWAAGAA
jgi:ADP-ribose pyrophosphatase